MFMRSYVNQFPPLCHQENSQFPQERNTVDYGVCLKHSCCFSSTGQDVMLQSMPLHQKNMELVKKHDIDKI